MGPIALFDESFLQKLTVDEAVWFDHFFMRNKTWATSSPTAFYRQHWYLQRFAGLKRTVLD